ncbi:hypothetical protein B0T26DRAFT_676077 [Lasiosphaeria miniovina]|uniref:Uncharacterized protein n=1 Tax=Lasiosphaeria miniovina TaxID=1954250 RepID=A0AA40AL30_9PEZI|nr:uncharacterized protein B0T26DRAFT_676077 [Lasiosphaeria miniovina]KAK0717823.1 hypothetical protein B0T26DRAFT_676077 [Lasiosphaeria miniovina]
MSSVVAVQPQPHPCAVGARENVCRLSLTEWVKAEAEKCKPVLNAMFRLQGSKALGYSEREGAAGGLFCGAQQASHTPPHRRADMTPKGSPIGSQPLHAGCRGASEPQNGQYLCPRRSVQHVAPHKVQQARQLTVPRLAPSGNAVVVCQLSTEQVHIRTAKADAVWKVQSDVQTSMVQQG